MQSFCYITRKVTECATKVPKEIPNATKKNLQSLYELDPTI